MVSGLHKLDALTRIVEAAEFDAMLVFVRTKQATVDLAERLQARGFSAAALNGDIQQSMREKTVGAAESRQVRHPGGHRRRGARPRRRARSPTW
jgi:ATP-dependent RNA helicase DeaD